MQEGILSICGSICKYIILLLRILDPCSQPLEDLVRDVACCGSLCEPCKHEDAAACAHEPKRVLWDID